MFINKCNLLLLFLSGDQRGRCKESGANVRVDLNLTCGQLFDRDNFVWTAIALLRGQSPVELLALNALTVCLALARTSLMANHKQSSILNRSQQESEGSFAKGTAGSRQA